MGRKKSMGVIHWMMEKFNWGDTKPNWQGKKQKTESSESCLEISLWRAGRMCWEAICRPVAAGRWQTAPWDAWGLSASCLACQWNSLSSCSWDATKMHWGSVKLGSCRLLSTSEQRERKAYQNQKKSQALSPAVSLQQQCPATNRNEHVASWHWRNV